MKKMMFILCAVLALLGTSARTSKKHQKELYGSFHSFVMAAELSPCDKHSDLVLRHLPLHR